MTLAETMVALAVGSVMMAGLVVTSSNLQQWFFSADFTIACQQDEATALDYIARDVRRSSAMAVENGDRKLKLTVPDQTSRLSDQSLAAPTLSGTTVKYGTTPGTIYYFISGSSFVRQDDAGTITLSKNLDEFHADLSAAPLVSLTMLFKPAPKRTTGQTVVARVNQRNLAVNVQ